MLVRIQPEFLKLIYKVYIAQMVEHQTVNLKVLGSNPNIDVFIINS